MVNAGQHAIVNRDGVRVTIDCTQAIKPYLSRNPTVTWFKDWLNLDNARNVVVSKDGRQCVITSTVAGEDGTDANYICYICISFTNCIDRRTTVAVCGKN